MNSSFFLFFIVYRVVIFVPGFSINSDTYSQDLFTQWARQAGFGDAIGSISLSFENGKWALSTPQDISNKDIFVLYFDRMTRSIDTLAYGLRTAVDYIAQNRDMTIGLVGYSMGGLIARAYVVKIDKGKRVKTLMTIATPHLGTPFANIYRYSDWFKPLGYEMDCPALREMCYPVTNNPFLTKLNKQDHPKDVSYINVICNPKRGFSLSEILFAIDSKKRFVDFFVHLIMTFLEVAFDCEDITDGLVPVNSQNMENVEGIKRKKIPVNKIELKCTHSEVMKHIGDFIYALDARPQIKFELRSRLSALFGGKVVRLTHNCFFWRRLKITKVLINGVETDVLVNEEFIEIPIQNWRFKNEIELCLRLHNYTNIFQFTFHKIF